MSQSQLRSLGVTAAGLAMLSVVACSGGSMGSPTSPTLTSASTAPTAAIGGDPIASPRPAEDPPPPPPPPPEGGQGCTPGYWKAPQHYGSWPAGYTPTMAFSDVFEDAFPGMTLVEVLGQGGGGLNALGRHTVAALLNSASTGVNYDVVTSDVISAFNGTYPSDDYESLKNILEKLNEQGCPLK
jgi:hypothetical protein